MFRPARRRRRRRLNPLLQATAEAVHRVVGLAALGLQLLAPTGRVQRGRGAEVLRICRGALESL